MRAFLSYSHADAQFANRLVFDLRGNGVDVWQDVKDLQPGTSIIESIQGVLSNCDIVLLILSPASVSSSWVQDEYRAALTLQRASGNRRPKIIPLIHRDCAIPLFLQDTLWIDFREKYDSPFAKLAKALDVENIGIPSSGLHKLSVALVVRAQLFFESVKAVNRNGEPLPRYDFIDHFQNLEQGLALALEMEAFAYRQLGFVDYSSWQIPESKGADGRPKLYGDMVTRRAFMQSVCRVVAGIVQLGERLGNISWLPPSYNNLMTELGLPEDHEFFAQLRAHEEGIENVTEPGTVL